MSDILAEARSWLGTPYQHQTSLKGVGCDCLGLIRGVWRALKGDEPWTLMPYSGDWAELRGDELLLLGLGAYFTHIDLSEAREGDILVFRLKASAMAKHAAILSEGDISLGHAKIIHAYWGHAVTESWLGTWWRRHLVAAFRF
jgi:NlpC/P60 family putative phage cell wall peptidase